MKKTKCNVYVVGNPGTGKSTVIKALTDFDSQKSRSTKSISADWIIASRTNLIEVEFKERRKLDPSLLKLVRQKSESKSFLIYITNSSYNPTNNSIVVDEAKGLLEYSKYVTIIIVHSGLTARHPKSLLTPFVRRYFSFAEFFVPQIVFQHERDSSFQFSYTIRRIISNACSDELLFAKAIIKENSISKDPVLDLGNCGLTSLRDIPELFQNTHITTLILSNEWGEFKNGVLERKTSKWKLEPNILFSIPPAISRLTNLKVLICGGNWNSRSRKTAYHPAWHISDITTLKRLTNITTLNLSNNDISSVTPLLEMTKLEILYVNNNSIIKFPDVRVFPKMKHLFLSNNRISDVTFLQHSRKIQTIDLHSNKVSDLTSIQSLILRRGISDSKWENGTISISNNPLVVPPYEIVAQGTKSVLTYFSQLVAEEKINLKPYKNSDIKLIMVGNSNVGKSTYVHWLTTGNIKTDIPSTHWLNFVVWSTRFNGKKYTFRIFDFGGQEYYHDTHHLFFTNRTAYVLLWDQRSNQYGEIEVEQLQLNAETKIVKLETFPLNYWLDSIRYHTQKRRLSVMDRNLNRVFDERDKEIMENVNSKWPDILSDSNQGVESIINESEEVNILVAQNKVDHSRLKTFIDEKTVITNYPKIFDFTEISVHNNKGLENSKSMLFEAVENLELSKRQYLGTWKYIKNEIEKRIFTTHMSLAEFLEFCNGVILKIPELKRGTASEIRNVQFNSADTELFASYLADIGLCLYYPESPRLRNQVFLNQKQILDAITKVLFNINKTTGEISEIEILDSLKKTKGDQEAQDLIDLMLHFKILFQHPKRGSDVYVAPLYLPQLPPHSINLFFSLFEKPIYRYRYDTFIHKSIILGLFQEYGAQAAQQTNEESPYFYWRNGIVIKDQQSGSIVMVKFEPGNQNNSSSILDAFTVNNSDEVFLKRVVEFIDQLNSGIKVVKMVPTTEDGDFIPLDIVSNNEKTNNLIFHYDKKYYKLIDFKKYLEKPMKMKKIFISYSKKDHRLVDKFIEHLSALRRDGKVEHWYCSELEPGTDWNDVIQKHLDESDIICFMISPSFMKTDYIHEYEIKKAFEKKQSNPNFKIVPIILDFCRWNTTNNDLGRYTALPYTAKPILDFDNPNMAWYLVEECLRLLIEHDLEMTSANIFKHEHLPSDVKEIYSRIVEGKVDKNTQA